MGSARTPDAINDAEFLGNPSGVRPVRRPPARSETPTRGQAAEHIAPADPAESRPAARRLGLIICAGMPRAGSTLQYNIVRLLAERYLGARAGGWYADFDSFAAEHPEYSDIAQARQGSAVQRPPLVIKLHGFDARFAALVEPPACGHVFHIYRDLRDALISNARLFDRRLSRMIESSAARWVELSEQWTSLRHVAVSRYEDAVCDVASEVRHCARALGIEVKDTDVNGIVDACSTERMRKRASAVGPGMGARDTEFLVHANHVADGRWGQWQCEMSPAQRERVWYLAGPWLERHGYPRNAVQDGTATLAAIRAQPAGGAHPGGVPLLRAGADPLVRALCDAVEGPLNETTGTGDEVPPRARVYFGAIMEVLPGDAVSNELLDRGYCEEGSAWALLRCLKPGDTFIDVGAHVGVHTMLGSQLVGNAGRVIAVEPNRAACEVLERNTRGASNVSVASLCETLAAICHRHDVLPDFVRIDAAQAGLNQLRAAGAVIRAARPIIVVKLSTAGSTASADEIVHFASSLGYQPWVHLMGGQFGPYSEAASAAHDDVLLLLPAGGRPHTGTTGSNDNGQGTFAALTREHTWAVAHEREARRNLLAQNRESLARVDEWRSMWMRQMQADARLHAAYVREVWTRLGARYETVALFGAGRYARWLLETVLDQSSRPRVVRLLDDASADGTTIAGLPVLRPGADALRGISAIVVATDDPSSPLIARCAEACAGLPRINLYDGIGAGPFPTESWLESQPRTAGT